jgi:hypothetical protein
MAATNEGRFYIYTQNQKMPPCLTSRYKMLKIGYRE